MFFGVEADGCFKDAINDVVVHGAAALNPNRTGTKAAASYKVKIQPGESATIVLRLTDTPEFRDPFGPEFDRIFESRIREADEYYSRIIPASLSHDARNVMRQSLAGLLWSKQFYHYVVGRWLHGDPAQPPPPESRRGGRCR